MGAFDKYVEILCYFENSTQILCYFLKTPEFGRSPKIWEPAKALIATENVRIVTQVGIHGETQPEHSGNPLGPGHTPPHIPHLVTTQIQSKRLHLRPHYFVVHCIND